MLRCLRRRDGPGRRRGFSSSPAMICAIESCAVREMFAMRAASAARALSLARSSLKTRPDGSAASSAGTSPVCSGVSVTAVSAAAASGALLPQAYRRRQGRPLSVRAPSRRASALPQARQLRGASGRRARWVRQRPPGRGLRRFGLAFRWARQAPARRERGSPVRGPCAPGSRQPGLFSPS